MWLVRMTASTRMGQPLVSYCWIDTLDRDDAIACARAIVNDSDALIAPICRTCIPPPSLPQPTNLSASAQ
jgi:hypothetical protein